MHLRVLSPLFEPKNKTNGGKGVRPTLLLLLFCRGANYLDWAE